VTLQLFDLLFVKSFVTLVTLFSIKKSILKKNRHEKKFFFGKKSAESVTLRRNGLIIIGIKVSHFYQQRSQKCDKKCDTFAFYRVKLHKKEPIENRSAL